MIYDRFQIGVQKKGRGTVKLAVTFTYILMIDNLF